MQFSFTSTEQVTVNDFKSKMASVLDVDPDDIVIVKFSTSSAKRELTFVTQATFYILGNDGNAKVELLKQLVESNDASLTSAGFENAVVTTPTGTTTGGGGAVSGSSLIVCNFVFLLMALFVLLQ